MLHGEQRDVFDLSFALPSECADRLAQGAADIGLVPSIELTRQQLEIIPGAGIACRGAVRSILLVSKLPFAQIRTLAVDASSRTSVALSRIVLSQRYGATPVLRAEKPDIARMLDAADACLIIGDPALLLDPADIPFHVLDLGVEWQAMTSLPMVFAVWARRREFREISPQPFRDSLQFGLQHIEDIVRAEHAKRRIGEELAREYLTRHIVFELGDAEYRGLERFLEYARQLRQAGELRTVSV